MQPILTVNIITYNHEKYIAKCLDSILSQKTEYEFIIRVFDDCSPDTTLKILSSYKEKYPTKVFVYPSEKNQGSLYNALRSYKNIETKYYMYIEGDDYVCSDEKFQKQIDILEENPDCSFCACKTKLIPSKECEKYLDEIIYPEEGEGKYTSDYFKNNNQVVTHISSRIVRTDCLYIDENNPRPYLFDFTQAYMLIEKGNFYLIDKPYSVYNYTGTGVYTGAKMKDRVDYLIDLFENFNKVTNYKYEISAYKLLGGEIFGIANRMTPKEIKKKPPIYKSIKAIKHYLLPPIIIDLMNTPRNISRYIKKMSKKRGKK